MWPNGWVVAVAVLVLLDANPLTAITNTTKIDAVVASGRLFRKKDLEDLLAKAASCSALENFLN